MNYLDLSIKEIHEAIVNHKVTPLELVQEAIKRAKNDKNNAFEYICEKEALEEVKNLDEKKIDNLLYGIPYVLKDNFSTKGIPTSASSNILNDYVPVYSSEVFLRLKNEGAIMIGKSTLDELAMGGTGTTGRKGRTFNPWDESHLHMIGGSSCGSAAAVASGIVPFSIGSDTGDSVRKPASYAGLVGFKPTWGRISRFGLFPFAPSLDHVAFFTRNVFDSSIILKALSGRDEKDATSSIVKVDEYVNNLRKELKGKRIAVIKEIYDSFKNPVVKEAFDKALTKMKEEGAIVEYPSLDINLCKAIYPTYMVISCAEATSNNANLDGIKFGPRFEGDNYEDVMKEARTRGFSELIKRRFVIGSYSLLRENQYDTFLRAQKCRHMIVDAVNAILDKYDAIFLPASTGVAPLFEQSSDKLSAEYLLGDNYLAIGNFAGLPSLTLPLGFENNLPFGANLTCKKWKEQETLNLALAIEDITGYKNLIKKGAN